MLRARAATKHAATIAPAPRASPIRAWSTLTTSPPTPVMDPIVRAAHTPQQARTPPNPAKADPAKDVANAVAVVEVAAVAVVVVVGVLVVVVGGERVAAPRRDQRTNHSVHHRGRTVRLRIEGRRTARWASCSREAPRVVLARSAAAASVAPVGGPVGGRVEAKVPALPAIPPAMATHDRSGFGSHTSSNPHPSGRPMNTPHDAR